MAGELKVKIQTPERVVFEGAADIVSSVNSAGPFDILPEHANIIMLIEGHPIQVQIGDAGKEYTFAKAVLSVADNKVTVFADIPLKEGEITRQTQINISDTEQLDGKNIPKK